MDVCFQKFKMKKENIIIGLLAVLLCLVSIFSLYVIGNAYEDGFEDGFEDGKEEVINEIINIVDENKHIIIYDNTKNRDLDLIEYHYSQTLCIKSLEEIFE